MQMLRERVRRINGPVSEPEIVGTFGDYMFGRGGEEQLLKSYRSKVASLRSGNGAERRRGADRVCEVRATAARGCERFLDFDPLGMTAPLVS
jgi:hypothetical protein